MNNNHIQIPQGYKMTSLGVIPQEWEVKRLGEIFSPISTFSFSREQMTVQEQQLRYVHYGDIHKNPEKDTVDLRKDELPFVIDGLIPQNRLDKVEFPYLKNGDILLADASEDYEGVGKPWEIINAKNCKVIGGLHTIGLRCESNEVVVGYGRYIFLNGQGAKALKRIAQGTKVYSISYNHISKLNILLPPCGQQERIAEILGCWDQSIELQGQLVEKLELRKRALMQQLLTARTRLKGFGGEWKETHIKDFSKEISIRNKSNKDMIVLSCTKYDGLVPSLEYFGRKIFAEDTSGYKVVHKHHFAYATNHIEEGSIGYQKNYDEALVSPMYTVFKTSASVNDGLLYTLLKSHRLIYQYNARMEGSIDRRGGLRWDSFSTIKIKLPSLAEQTAIAEILTNADKEIDLARKKLATLRQQKKGLMQQLLTGKTRVKI